MKKPLFLGDDPDCIVEKARRLADDIERLAAGLAPTPGELEQAPVLDQWEFATIERPILVGSVVGHPILGDRPFILTSDLYVLDPHGLWARSWSRYFRLGRPRDDNRSGQ